MKIHGTAKGGALSKKDFGVAFGGAAPCVEATYSIADSYRNTQRTMGKTGGTWRKFAGIKNAFGSATLTEAKVYLDNDSDGGTAGFVQLAVYASDGSNKRVLGDGIAISGLSSTLTEKTFEPSESNPDPISVDVDDLIGVTIDEAPANNYKYNVGIWKIAEQYGSATTWEINNLDVLSTFAIDGQYAYLCGLELTYCA